MKLGALDIKTSEVCVIGRSGFIGKAIADRVGCVTSVPTKDTKVLFHFASHVHPVFELNPDYEIHAALNSFRYLLNYCSQNGILFVFPSSALVYEKDTEFAHFKKALESLAASYPATTLGLRIFPAYGPGEDRTVISQWCRQMRAGKRPVVYGDGRQSRDFIFVDDVVDQIFSLVEKPCWASRIVDIGTGIRTSFNSIIDIINKLLGSDIRPQYHQRPWGYSEGIACANPLPVRVSIERGIQRVLASI